MNETEKELIERFADKFGSNPQYWELHDFMLKEVRNAVAEKMKEIEEIGGIGQRGGEWGIALSGSEWQALKGGEDSA